MNKTRAFLAASLMSLLAAPSLHAYTHPGVPLTASGLAAIKAKVLAGEQPWKSGYDAMAGDWTSALTYAPRGATTTVSRNPNVNLTDHWRPDMIAAYNQARMWYFTGNATYAQTARTILLNWATTQTSFGGMEANLDLGDYAVYYVGAADILRSTYSGWSAADTTVVQKFFSSVYWPPLGLDNDELGPTNKGSLSLAAGAAIAEFCDDTAKMNRVIYHLQYTPSTGFINTLPNGQHGETGRDNGHASNHILAMAFVGQVLWNQGTDIFSYYDNRLLAMGEYHGAFNVSTNPTYVPMGTTDEYYLTNWSTPGFTGDTSLYNILKTAYGVRKGMNMRYLDALFGTQAQNMVSFMYLLPSDSSTATPLSQASLPSATPLGSGLSNSDIGGATPGGGGAYSNGVWTVNGAGSEIWTHGNESFHYTYTQVAGDCTLIARVTSVQNTSSNAKAGVMIRSDLNATPSACAWIAVKPSTALESYFHGWGQMYGGSNWEAQGYPILSIPWWVKIERRGNVVTTYASRDGTSWATIVCARYDNLPSSPYYGLCVCSMVNGTLNTSTFDHVSITGGTGGATVAAYAPEAVQVAGGINQVQLRWTASFGATGYSVDRAVQGGGYLSIAQVNNGNCSYLDTSVTNGTTYNYKIRALNSAGSSGDSAIVTAFAGASNGTYKLINRYSGKCLNLDGPSTADGANVTQWAFVGASQQKWNFTHLGSGIYEITNGYSGKALDVEGPSTADGANIHQWGYIGNDNQKWKIEAAGGGFYRLISLYSGKAADLQGPSTADGANVWQWSLGSQDSQKWSISPQ